MDSSSTEAVRAKLRARGLSCQFCLVPFTTLIIEPDGRVGCCRQKGTDFSVGDLRTQSLDEIWNGAPLRSWRREFLSGTPETCRTEIRHSACNLCPDYNSLLGSLHPQEIMKSKPRRIGLNLNGKCNLRCQMCVVWQKPDGILDELDLFKALEPYAADLDEVELHSGEPFIQRDTYRLIDWLSVRNPRCLWTFTTNGHWRLTDRLKTALNRIRIKNLILSLDSLDSPTYAKIRRGGTLSRVLDNLERLRAYDAERISAGCGSMNIRVNFLIQRDNWREVGRISDFERESGLSCFRSLLREPEPFSLLTLPQAKREKILETCRNELDAQQLRDSVHVLLPLIDSLPRIDQVPHWLHLNEALKQGKY